MNSNADSAAMSNRDAGFIVDAPRRYNEMSPQMRRTDVGNALLFAHWVKGQALYARDVGEWMTWSDTHWSRGDDAAILGYALDTAYRLASLFYSGEHEQAQWLKWAASSLSRPRVLAMPDLAKADESIACRRSDFDREAMLLNCPNGTVELRTKVLRPHRAEDHITKMTAIEYDPDASAPRFMEFLDGITQGSPSLQHYLQVLLGYCATGSVAEEVLPIFYGRGGNGKSKLVEAVFAVLGDYGVKASSDLLVKTRGDKHADLIMHLIGSRLAIATEAAQGARLDERIVKELTGGDTVNARALYSGSHDYRPTWKLLWRTNDLPNVDRYDDAIRRRIRVVPFNASFVGRENRNLDAEFASESTGILRWLVDGAHMWHEALSRPGSTTGLPSCVEVDVQTQEYESDNDPLAPWLDAHTMPGKTDRGELWIAYRKWASFAHEYDVEPLLTRNAFYGALRARGITECRIGSRNGFEVGLKNEVQCESFVGL